MPISSPSPPSLIPPAQTSAGSVKDLAQQFRFGTGEDAGLWSAAGDGLSSLQTQVDVIMRALRSGLPQASSLVITSGSGAVVAALGDILDLTNNTSYTGIWTINLWLGGSGPATGTAITPDDFTGVTLHGTPIAGASQRTAETKGILYNVEQFGTVGDGVTDDTAALTLAISTAHSLGAAGIHIPGGTYLISSPLPLYSGQRLEGDKWNDAVILIAASFSGVTVFDPTIGATVTDCFDSELSNLAIRCFHDLSAIWVVKATTLTSYVRITHHSLFVTGLNGFTLTALGNSFIGATRNCEWTDCRIQSLDYDQSPAWAIGTTYAAGATVNYGTPALPYQSKAAGNVGHQPDISPAQWLLLENCYADVGWQINQGDLNVLDRCQIVSTGRGIHTTCATSIATGSQTVTPVNIHNIQVGSVLAVMNSDGTNFEKVTVTGQSGSTFTATFASTKTGPGIRIDGQIRLPVSTTVTANISNSPHQVVTPASMTGITQGGRFWIANSDGSNNELAVIESVTGSTFTVSLANGAKTGPGITVTGPVEDPFLEVRAGSNNTFIDLEISPGGLNINKPRMWAASDTNLIVRGYFNEEIKVPSDAGSEYGIYLFECVAFQFTGQTRPDPYRRIYFVRSSGVIESMSPGSFGGASDFLEQFLGFDLTNTKSSVLLRQLYTEQNRQVRTQAWADQGLIIDRVSVAFEVLGHSQESSVPATNRFDDYNAQNLIVNPSFEAGLYGYQCNDVGAAITFPVSEVGIGNMISVATGSSGTKTLNTNIQVVITSAMMNRPLTFTAWVKMTATLANPATSQSKISIFLQGVAGSPAPTNSVFANQGWVRMVQTFVPAQAGNLFVGLNINGDAADSAWTLLTDDWHLSVGSVGGIDTSRFGSVILNGSTITSTTNGNPPGNGTWKVGDFCFDATGVTVGWRCTVAGTPGTWYDVMTGLQVTLQAAAAANPGPGVVWQTTGVAASATEVRYSARRSTNDTDWLFFSFDGASSFQNLQALYNAGSPQLKIGNSGGAAVAVVFPGVTASRPLKVDGSNVLTASQIDLSSANDATGVLAAGRFPALTGDITTSAGALATALKATGAAGTYTRVTFDAQGRETSGTDLGISPTRSFGISLTINSDNTAVRGTPAAGQSNFTAVTSVTLNLQSNTWTNGILTA